MSVKIRREIGFDSGNETSVQIRLNREIRTILGIFIPISMGISQSKSRITADGDKLRNIKNDRIKIWNARSIVFLKSHLQKSLLFQFYSDILKAQSIKFLS